MPVSDIVFQGINRAASDYSNAGACEELINLRPTGTGLAPVKPFGIKMLGITYDKVFVHKAGTATNYLAIKTNGYLKEIYRISESGQIIGSRLGWFNVLGCYNFDIQKHVHFAYTGNIVLFSVCDRDGEDELLENFSFLWDGTEYKVNEADIPDISGAYINATTPDLLQSSINSNITTSSTKAEIIDGLNQSLNALQEERREYCFGPVIVALAFKTNDGKTFWTGKWMIHDPLASVFEMEDVITGNVPYIITESAFPSPTPAIENFFNKYPKAFVTNYWAKVYMAGQKLDVVIPRISGWSKDTSILKSVEIYASRPVIYPDTTNYLEYDGEHFEALLTIVPPVTMEDMALGNQLLYLQKSIPLEKLKEESVTTRLIFGGNKQTTETTLAVDAGAVTRYGQLLAYNARFHYFDSYAKVQIGMPEFVFHETPSYTVATDVFVLYNDGQKDTPIYCGVKQLPEHYFTPADIIISPSLGVKQVVTQQPAGDMSATSRIYPMKASSRYNYSYCDDKGVSEPYRIPMYSPTSEKSYAIVEEPAAINVTEQYNPFVFKVEHSYLAPGKILDVQPQMVAVRDVTFGDYPLNVFTNRGLYALLQGNGIVLYGNFRSISNLVTTANAVPTEIGTFFIAAGNLWLVSGDNAVLISDALNPGPHKFIRDSAGYRAIAAGQYDVTTLLSQVPFDEYVNGVNGKSGATLAYNRYRDELFVSNPEYDYTYVLSLKYRQWFKMSLTLSQDVVGSDVATVPIGSVKNIVDFTEELETVEDTDTPVSVLVHYQTRPFSIGYQYIHVHRLLSMIRANLSTDDLLIVGLYGSDNLQDWKLLSYASRSGIKISQIRTPSAARSWRYYTVCVGGLCPWDTDFGNTLFEYQPVIRRIG